VNEWLKSRYNSFPLIKACYSTSDASQIIPDCIQDHGKKCAMRIDNQQITALHILCSNPRVTGDAIQVYLQLVPEAANEQDLNEMTPFQHLCRNDVSFLEDRNFSA